jgi:hypothetical protein
MVGDGTRLEEPRYEDAVTMLFRRLGGLAGLLTIEGAGILSTFVFIQRGAENRGPMTVLLALQKTLFVRTGTAKQRKKRFTGARVVPFFKTQRLLDS